MGRHVGRSSHGGGEGTSIYVGDVSRACRARAHARARSGSGSGSGSSSAREAGDVRGESRGHRRSPHVFAAERSRMWCLHAGGLILIENGFA